MLGFDEINQWIASDRLRRLYGWFECLRQPN